jgi:glyoxylase-like metal-dependent hydrolase (beta-lactamase superfamily II)
MDQKLSGSRDGSRVELTDIPAIEKDTTPMDVEFLGHPRAIAACLLESNGSAAIIDPGPTSALPKLRENLAARGLSVRDINFIFLTHIHLDHAGATGTLVRENPRIRVLVHEFGAARIADPAKLIQSAARLYGADMERLWGEILPVPGENMKPLAGGESVRLGSRTFDVLYTPGHASHHVTYFEEASGIAFVGDAAGIRIANQRYVLPVTPPPDIDVEAWNQSMQLILTRRPERLFLTHFGFADGTSEHFDELRARLEKWSGMVRHSLASAGDDAQRVARFSTETAEDLRGRLPAADSERYIRGGGLDLSWYGLARYWHKRPTQNN